MAIVRELGGDQELEPYLLRLMGCLAIREGTLPEAKTALSKSLEGCHRNGNRFDISHCFDEISALATELREAGPGSRLAGAAAALHEALGNPIAPVDAERFGEARMRCRAMLGDSAYDAAHREGKALTLDQAVDEALAVCGYPRTGTARAAQAEQPSDHPVQQDPCPS